MKNTYAWGWLAAGVLALGLNGIYQDGGAAWAHRALDQGVARLAESSLGGKVFLTNSGAEAIEAAIKLARRARPGGRIVVLQGAFHGRTYGALSATPQESKQAPFAPLVPGFVVVPKDPDALRSAVDDFLAEVRVG